jgi:hypothetical protein
LWELTADLSWLVERRAAGEHTRAKALPEDGPFGRSQTLKSNRLRQPAGKAASNYTASQGDRSEDHFDTNFRQCPATRRPWGQPAVEDF